MKIYRHDLDHAAADIRDLRRVVQSQAAQLRIVDIFAAALGFRMGGEFVSRDMASMLEEISHEMLDKNVREIEIVEPSPLGPGEYK